MIKILGLIVLLVVSPRAEANWFSDLYQKLFSNKNEVSQAKIIELPSIPKVNRDAKSIETYKKIYPEIKIKKPVLKLKYDRKFTLDLFNHVKNRKVTDDEMSEAIMRFSQGASREGYYRSLILDQEFRNLEDKTLENNKEFLKFLVHYFHVYLAQKQTAKSLNQLNFYSLKRISIEKSLELLDTFPNAHDIRSWYAVLSSELAKNFSSVFKSDFRKSEQREKHYRWASNVPFQHIKSEVIIKLNMVFNFLQKDYL